MKINVAIEVEPPAPQVIPRGVTFPERRIVAADIEEFWRGLPEDQSLAEYRLFTFRHPTTGENNTWSLDLPFMRALWDAINSSANSK